MMICLLSVLLPGPLGAQGIGRGGGRGLNQPPGIRAELGYAADLFKPAKGGFSQDAVALDNLDLLLHLSLNPLLGIRGTSIRIHVQSNRGESVSSEVGNLQEISSLEAPREWRLYEAWIGHQFGSPRISVLAGIYDVNSEFDALPSAGDFLNGSFAFGPEFARSGVAGPSTFPNTGLAARMRFEPTATLYGLFAVSDGVPGDQGAGRFSLDDQEGALISVEVGYAEALLNPISVSAGALPTGRRTTPTGRLGRGAAGRPLLRGPRRQIGRGRSLEDVKTKVGVGGWAYTRRLEGWASEGSSERSWGIYLLGERLLHQKPDGAGGLSGFVRAGTAAEEVGRLDLSLEGGLVYRGLMASRPDDLVGMGVAYARNGSPYLRVQRMEGRPMERGETVLELTYKAQLGRFFVVQPDLQWIRNPGMDPDLGDALVVGLRGHFLLELPEGATGS
jgi:porin